MVDYDVTPWGFLNNARVWRDIYFQNIDSPDTITKVVSTYCLLISMEMFIKAHIVLNDESYAKASKIRGEIGHDFQKLLKKISNPKIFKILEEILLEFRLDKFKDSNFLRYPQEGDSFFFSKDYLDKNNKIIQLTLIIEEELSKSSLEIWPTR